MAAFGNSPLSAFAQSTTTAFAHREGEGTEQLWSFAPATTGCRDELDAPIKEALCLPPAVRIIAHCGLGQEAQSPAPQPCFGVGASQS
ncbi:hypothetical protein BAUCODRAFT_118555 [Baudoinia panamericana UAMH 10762]|uniref:Uncharacterized protein n=1 Tax=Baudoinia panamericana (strain UAMH 10762) TaxID=717646 RepID=M2M199_BAUPA|nr:uncharacterized protein BAUCODRAFT_118555 [Baudoinia panamericana UAMH 10762]EMD00823.1 hypothetical protein BAUCODRAFT_118555 [Baudoinia panamericana UAMH 10762]